MTVIVRRASEADANYVASLLAELGYPSSEADIRSRLRRSLPSRTSCFLLAQSGSEITGLVSAELVPYVPNGSTICRVTAREHHCSGIEITSAEHRRDAHRFYRRLGFSGTSIRFFRSL